MISIMALKNNSLHSSGLRRAATMICLVGISSLACSAQRGSPPIWARGLQFEAANSAGRAHGLSLYYVDQGKVHLTGTWWYENGAVAKETPPRVVIEGRRTPDGVFWPDITLQVKNELTGKWQILAKPPSHGRRATIIIEPNNRNFDLMVNLDVLKPLIGNYKFGRIVLKTGEAAVFELKYLLPPKGA
jgi:hypothetical protein